MAILADNKTRVLVQGLTGAAGTFHAKQMREYGTSIVGGVTPGKGGIVHEGFPVFDTVAQAVAKTGANTSVIFVPPPGGADAILEAADAGIELIVCITEGIPVLDMVRAKRALDSSLCNLVGPNCPVRYPRFSLRAVTRVYRGHVLAALTRPLARRLCRLQPPPPSPAPCRVYDGRARRSHRPALASRRYW